MDKYESYRVLNNLDSDIDSDRDWKDIQYWINALCDGEYLSMYDYSEEAVNSAVESLERLNQHTFMLFDLGILEDLLLKLLIFSLMNILLIMLLL